ncbi:MAG: HAMP domain-containing histidine kinase [Lachnospiraceae bacterium]|nr:HAMP domain-containing histidine kinase [Lachnospiraceae bacterium]
MSGKQYLKNQLPVILLNLSGLLLLALFLIASGNNIQSILFIAFVWLFTVICYLTIAFFLRKRHLDKLFGMTEQLEERYLIAEIMEVPERADEQVFYRVMKMAEKSMLEKINEIQRERKEYKEYIEQWVHEAKTPITAMKLLCENNRSDFTREMLTELENMNRYTEQALYYARSEHTEKDYSIREIALADVIHDAIADNKYILRQNHVKITIDDMGKNVYTDDKWLRFILDQIISNAVKYRTEQPALHFFTMEKEGRVLLTIEDNGIGIPQSDLPRIFEKGFTGENGRIIQSATGIGLYLCKKLCDKLEIGLEACSDGEGTAIRLSFQINDFIGEVQGE